MAPAASPFQGTNSRTTKPSMPVAFRPIMVPSAIPTLDNKNQPIRPLRAGEYALSGALIKPSRVSTRAWGVAARDIKKQRIREVKRRSRLIDSGEARPCPSPGFPGKKGTARMALIIPLLTPQGQTNSHPIGISR